MSCNYKNQPRSPSNIVNHKQNKSLEVSVILRTDILMNHWFNFKSTQLKLQPNEIYQCAKDWVCLFQGILMFCVESKDNWNSLPPASDIWWWSPETCSNLFIYSAIHKAAIHCSVGSWNDSQRPFPIDGFTAFSGIVPGNAGNGSANGFVNSAVKDFPYP